MHKARAHILKGFNYFLDRQLSSQFQYHGAYLLE